MNQPAADPSQEGAQRSSACSQFPSWEGLVRRSTEIRTTKSPITLRSVVRHSSFGFLSSFVIRHSLFDNLCEAVQVSMHGIKVIEAYFRRAHKAGVIRIDDPRAAARLFMGSLQSYVFLHHVMNVPHYPVDRFIDALIDLWTHGGIRAPKEKNRSTRVARDRASVDRDRRHADLPATVAKAARARAVGNAGSANRKRRVARRRPHRPSSRR